MEFFPAADLAQFSAHLHQPLDLLVVYADSQMNPAQVFLTLQEYNLYVPTIVIDPSPTWKRPSTSCKWGPPNTWGSTSWSAWKPRR